MLIIEVKNAREVVRKRIGRLGERLMGKVVDPELQVEKALIQEMESAFEEFGIEARILSVEGPRVEGGESIEFPLNVRAKIDLKFEVD